MLKLRWKRLEAREGDNRDWVGWMASLTQWTWIWAGSGSWWWTEKSGVLQSMESQRVRHDWATELNLVSGFVGEVGTPLSARVSWVKDKSSWKYQQRDIFGRWIPPPPLPPEGAGRPWPHAQITEPQIRAAKALSYQARILSLGIHESPKILFKIVAFTFTDFIRFSEICDPAKS